MSTENTAPRTALAPQVAAEGSLSYSFDHLQRMASAIAKSGMFPTKTPEAALTILLIARAEGVHPMQAIQDYDVIEGKPALKSGAMLTRFIRAGGKVEWLEQSDAKVSGKFTAPNGSTITVTWDVERVTKAGLAGKAVHQKYPMQMKRARCISEAIRAIWPVTTLYTREEMIDGAVEVDITPVSANEVVRVVTETAAATGTALTEAERQEHFDALDAAHDLAELAKAFAAAWKHAGEAKDKGAQDAFKTVYDAKKAAFTQEGQV